MSSSFAEVGFASDRLVQLSLQDGGVPLLSAAAEVLNAFQQAVLRKVSKDQLFKKLRSFDSSLGMYDFLPLPGMGRGRAEGRDSMRHDEIRQVQCRASAPPSGA